MLPPPTRLIKMKPDPLALLAAQKSLWECFYQLTREQAELLAMDKINELLLLIKRKEKCIKALKVLQKEVDAVKEAGGFDIAGQEQIKAMQQEISKLVEDCQQIDKANCRKISADFHKLRQQLEDFSAGKTALSGYIKALSGNRGIFVDFNR